jgi:hypothetical protein
MRSSKIIYMVFISSVIAIFTINYYFENFAVVPGVSREEAEVLVSKEFNKELNGYRPKDGYVPNTEIAIDIATSVWKGIYGKERISAQSPYFAYLINDIWMVSGSFSKFAKGGTAKALISRETGEILYVSHDR